MQITTCPKVEEKQSSRGETVFVTEQREIYNEHGLAVTETRQLAYMHQQPPGEFAKNAKVIPGTLPLLFLLSFPLMFNACYSSLCSN
jgi:hydroxyacyl-ACP dehydratase HTD2-like protein with hotdog domain